MKRRWIQWFCEMAIAACGDRFVSVEFVRIGSQRDAGSFTHTLSANLLQQHVSVKLGHANIAHEQINVRVTNGLQRCDREGSRRYNCSFNQPHQFTRIGCILDELISAALRSTWREVQGFTQVRSCRWQVETKASEL